MLGFILDMLLAGSQTLSALPSSSPGPQSNEPEPRKPSWAGLPVSLLCAAGAVGSVYWMFFQNGDLWQIAKLLLLTLILGVLAVLGLRSFVDGRRLKRAQRRADVLRRREN